ncbi:MAG: hypothetical protein KC493_00225 [Bacteriovoracaceae bacterium]|nr:hypothetical protein [Bacteriovoracaceae bacterium]
MEVSKDSEILEKFSQDFLGIIWVTKSSLENKPDFFETMDYLMDGVLTKFLSNESFVNSKKNLFIGKSFDRPFFLIHLEENLQKILEESKNLLKISLKEDEPRKKFLVINNTNARISKELSKSFPGLEFESVN